MELPGFEINCEDPTQLANTLSEWAEAYTLGFPMVPDWEYDHYKGVLFKLDPENRLLKQVGTKSKRNKVLLPYTMGSLKNRTHDDIDEWLVKYKSYLGYVLSHKLDGVAILVCYDQGIMKSAYLRGDGLVGEDITMKANTFVPLTIDNKEQLDVTGEILLSVDPKELGYKNRRNAVAGILHRDDNKHLEHLNVIFHGWKNPTGEYAHRESLRLQFLSSILPTVRYEFLPLATRDKLKLTAEQMLEEVTPYDKDGIVVAVENAAIEDIKLPEFKIAYKFNKMIAKTFVRYIEWNVSRTRRIIPLCYIEPVELGGTTVGKCTAFNAKFVKDSELGLLATINVVRSGDVIPYIEEVIQKSDIMNIPEICPSCETKLEMDGVHLICPNVKCPTALQKSIAYFFIQMGLEFFSEKMISSLNCTSILDVFQLTEVDIKKIPGWGDTSAKDFIQRIQDIKNSSPDKLIASLGIPNLANSTAKLLINEVGFDSLIRMGDPTDSTPSQAYIGDLMRIKGIAEKKAVSIYTGIKENFILLQELKNIGITTEKKDGPLKGLSFCITGSLSKPRKIIEKWIEDSGGSNSSISSCKYLICNDTDTSSAKIQKAKKDGIKIITEEELVHMYIEARR